MASTMLSKQCFDLAANWTKREYPSQWGSELGQDILTTHNRPGWLREYQKILPDSDRLPVKALKELLAIAVNHLIQKLQRGHQMTNCGISFQKVFSSACSQDLRQPSEQRKHHLLHISYY